MQSSVWNAIFMTGFGFMSSIEVALLMPSEGAEWVGVLVLAKSIFV
jgi:hypothetical protein